MDFGKVQLDDGTEGIGETAEDRFVKWLTDNGAKFPKIQWPARNTVGGVRGTVALDDIATDEHMLEIPTALMLSPPRARASPEIGHVFEENPALFAGDDDRVLAAYMVFERLRGADSFWAPYFDVLPMPGSIADWSVDELKELQHPRLEMEARTRHPRMKLVFERVFDFLCTTYPTLFPRERVTFDLFRWAWGTIQARAFGRRLPWTALVPFADCLNHANVATKYDFDVGGNGVFRLRPTAGNAYAKGAEVFNSYGRRDNRHLLLEYGFAIENNEWEPYELKVSMPASTEHYEAKVRLLSQYMFSVTKSYRLQWMVFNLEVLAYHRVRVATAEELGDEAAMAKFFMEPVSARNEIAALAEVSNLYARELSRFPTSLAEDEAALARARGGEAGGISPSLMVALVARVTRKRILAQQKAWVDALAPLFQVASAQRGQLRSLRDPVSYYVSTVLGQLRPPCPPPKHRMGR